VKELLLKKNVIHFTSLPNSLMSGLLKLLVMEVQYNSSISLWYGTT